MTILSQPFYGNNFGHMGASRWYQAAHYGDTIQKDRAGATFAFGAAFLSPGQERFLAQQPEQGFILPGIECVLAPVNIGHNWLTSRVM